jgi:hypothetical protein
MLVHLEPGQTIDRRYVLRGQLGRGGMATVYEAFDPKLDMPVVLKILPRVLVADPTFVGRFRREGRTLARLTHPHIVRLYDLGENDGEVLYYLVLEYLRGGTLKARQGTEPWPVVRVVEVLRSIALALDYAHRQNPPIVHRDLKPANILFGDHDRAVVSDFGLARMIAPDQPRTSDMTTWGSITGGAVLGTPAYMAPEQAEGYPPDERADRYSLGVIAYELLVGVVPFLADTPQATLIQVVTKPLPLPSQLNPAIDSALERVLLKALARDPALRFDSALEFVESLESAGRGASHSMSDAHLTAQDLTTIRPPRWRPRRRLLAATGALLAVVAFAGVVLGTRLSSGTNVAGPLATATPGLYAAVAEQPLPTVVPTPHPQATLTLAPTAAPTLEPTPDAVQIWRGVLAELDTTWGHDWARTITLLDESLARDPANAEAHDKLYAALVFSGQQLVADGATDEGVRRLERAETVAPERSEARDALQTLTPMSTPTASPVPSRQVEAPVRPTIAPARAAQPAQPTPTPLKSAFQPPTPAPAPPTKPPFTPPGGP